MSSLWVNGINAQIVFKSSKLSIWTFFLTLKVTKIIDHIWQSIYAWPQRRLGNFVDGVDPWGLLGHREDGDEVPRVGQAQHERAEPPHHHPLPQPLPPQFVGVALPQYAAQYLHKTFVFFIRFLKFDWTVCI